MKFTDQTELVLRSASVALLAFIGVSACLGGGLLILDPTGALLQLSPSLLSSTMFEDFLIPGIFLFFVLGIGNLLTAAVVLRGFSWFPFLVTADGIILATWISVQAWLIQLVVPQQLVIATIGLVLTGLGIAQWQDRNPHRISKPRSFH